MDIVRTNPLPHTRLGHLKDEMDSLFGSIFNDFPGRNARMWAPPVDLSIDEDAVNIRAELPGLNKDDVELYIHGTTMTLSGEKKTETTNEKADRIYAECSYGRFSRQISLPEGLDADKVNAEFKDGVLNVRIPKSEQTKPKRIELKS